MPFVAAAREFVLHPETIRTSLRKREIMVDSVEFLLDNNHIGRNNAVSTEVIIEYLNGLGHSIQRGPWETDILGALRDNEIWIGSKLEDPQADFIIQNRDDAEVVKTEYWRKVPYNDETISNIREIGNCISTKLIF